MIVSRNSHELGTITSNAVNANSTATAEKPQNSKTSGKIKKIWQSFVRSLETTFSTKKDTAIQETTIAFHAKIATENKEAFQQILLSRTTQAVMQALKGDKSIPLSNRIIQVQCAERHKERNSAQETLLNMQFEELIDVLYSYIGNEYVLPSETKEELNDPILEKLLSDYSIEQRKQFLAYMHNTRTPTALSTSMQSLMTFGLSPTSYKLRLAGTEEKFLIAEKLSPWGKMLSLLGIQTTDWKAVSTFLQGLKFDHPSVEGYVYTPQVKQKTLEMLNATSPKNDEPKALTEIKQFKNLNRIDWEGLITHVQQAVNSPKASPEKRVQELFIRHFTILGA